MLLLTMIFSRIINERGYKLLSSEEKLRLMDGFSKIRAYAMIPLFALIAIYLLLMKKTDLDKGDLFTIYMGLLILFIIIRTVLNHRKLVSLNLPAGYRRYFMTSQIVSLLGAAWFLFAFLGSRG